MQPAGQDPEACVVPGTVTLPLCSRTNASPFWIMLLRVWGRLDHGRIPELAHNRLADPQLRGFTNSPWTPYGFNRIQAWFVRLIAANGRFPSDHRDGRMTFADLVSKLEGRDARPSYDR
jgi:hypothetical protein